MKRLLFLDVETTDVEIEQGGELAEIGTILWSVDHNCIMTMQSTLVRTRGPNKAERINGIPGELLSIAPEYNAERISKLVSRADAVVAYNASFDRKWFPEDVQRMVPWLCAMDDFEWPCGGTSKKLSDLVLAHGMGISRAHRAIDDCLMMVSLFEHMVLRGRSVPDMLSEAALPKSRYVADVSFKTNQLAKDAGFRWKPETKEWWRWMHDHKVDRLPFACWKMEAW